MTISGNIGGPVLSIASGIILDRVGEEFAIIFCANLIAIGRINIFSAIPPKKELE
ncbi:hypothetical protein [Lactobacillus apis]|uniref:hypothetical protein n=1 Tax=Lactobacillus apis TaxID=303541 RepID=UPI00242FABE5|nr:hypothetical protein [Lactobacillus apis]